MWQALVSALGGAFFLHYLKNFLLKENRKFRWEWDGIVERGLITYFLVTNRWLVLIPVIILIKIFFRLSFIGFFNNLAKIGEPGTVPQKVILKSELAFDLLLSPAFAILIGMIFQ